MHFGGVFMASLREYLEKMDTGSLDAILFQEAFGKEQVPLSTIYLICRILARREPNRGNSRDIFLEFAGQYADRRAFVE